jgi:hypothetical protein
MTRFYEPDLTVDPNSPFVRDASNKLVRRGYWIDMNDRTLVNIRTHLIHRPARETSPSMTAL